MARDDTQYDPDARSQRYFRHAVEHHWDPHEIDLADDLVATAELSPQGFDLLRTTLARFGAGERAVTEDLAPLAVVLDDIDDQAFVTSQLYEEAKHLDFFDRYWREVVHSLEDDRGLDRTAPTADRWFNGDYTELFERAMYRLIDDDSPKNRATAYCHYHLTIEGILAQTGYFGLTATYGDDGPSPDLPGLVTGLAKIRGDEGRHVGFGMTKLKGLVETSVEPSLLNETVNALLPLVAGTVPEGIAEAGGMPENELVMYALEKHGERMRQVTTDEVDVPDVETLTSLER